MVFPTSKAALFFGSAIPASIVCQKKKQPLAGKVDKCSFVPEDVAPLEEPQLGCSGPGGNSPRMVKR